MVLFFLIISTIIGCKKDFGSTPIELPETETLKILNEKERETLAKFEHASLVLQGLFSSSPSIRKEFNGFIAAKLKKSGTDEELTFKEIFQAKPINLSGVKSDFLVRFRDAFAGLFINGKYPKSEHYVILNFKTIEDVAAYFELKATASQTSPIQIQNTTTDNQSVPYEIYFPYSENWDIQAGINYAVSFYPLTNVEWNYGMFYNMYGNPLYEVTVDDAYGTPTYIITYDDGLKLEDFSNGLQQVEASRYHIGLTDDDDYNPIVMETPITPNPSPCLKELRVKDGRWTLLRNGYGIFEGKIEFAVAVTINVSEVTVPNQNPQSNCFI